MEAAIAKMTDNLQGVREILIQTMNDTNSTADRRHLQQEYDSYLAEFDKIANTASYAGQTFFTGDDTIVGTTNSNTPFGANDYVFQVGSGASSNDQLWTRIYQFDIKVLGTSVQSLDISRDNAVARLSPYVDYFDQALSYTNSLRGAAGSLSNVMYHLVSNLTNKSMNLAVSQSKITDADFALETTNLAKQQIMVQAGTAMLAQANASKSSVLALLQV